jgi:hypothetical protein
LKKVQAPKYFCGGHPVDYRIDLRGQGRFFGLQGSAGDNVSNRRLPFPYASLLGQMKLYTEPSLIVLISTALPCRQIDELIAMKINAFSIIDE